MLSLADLIRNQAAEQPDKPAFVCEHRTLTFQEVHAESSQVANALLAAGVEATDRVGYIGKNVPEYFALSYGVAKLNAVTVGVNWRLAPPEMDYVLENAEAKVVVVEEEFAGHLTKMDLPRNPLIVTIGGSTGHLDFGDWIATMPTTDPMASSSLDDTAMQLYTSGTTGLPKGVELTNRNVEAFMAPFAETIGLHRESVVLIILPMFHIAGAGAGHLGVWMGCTSIVQREVDPMAILAAIPEHDISILLLVPAILQVLPTLPGAAETDFSSVDRALYGASPIAEDALTTAMDLLECPMVQVYGLTETSGAVTRLEPEDHDPGGPKAHLLRSAGKPMPGVDLRIVDTDGRDVAPGEVGEVWLRSHQNMKAYWKNPEATAAAFPEGRDDDGLGWFTSGDAGYLEDGYLFIHDRVKDMIVSGAENIYPAEVENAVMAHPDVADVAVIGIPSERWGESTLAVIVANEGTTPSAESILEFCEERLARYKLPKDIEFVAELPRNPTGKVMKTELRKPYWDGHHRAVN